MVAKRNRQRQTKDFAGFCRHDNCKKKQQPNNDSHIDTDILYISDGVYIS